MNEFQSRWRDEETKARKHKHHLTYRWYRHIEEGIKRNRIRYWMMIAFWNPYYTGRNEKYLAGMQWLEFVVRLPSGQAGCVLVNTGWGLGSGPHKYRKRAMESKKRFLTEANIPFIILDKSWTIPEYQMAIARWHQRQTERRIPNTELRTLRNSLTRPSNWDATIREKKRRATK